MPCYGLPSSGLPAAVTVLPPCATPLVLNPSHWLGALLVVSIIYWLVLITITQDQ